MNMLETIFTAVKDTIVTAFIMLNGSSGWLMISFVLAGVLHNVVTPERFQEHLGNKKVSSLLKSTISGMFLPICSCGVIPIGISMYYSGAYLGPMLAFMTSTPIINPIAVILCFGLLGPQITIIYIIAGFTLPMLVGFLGNTFAKDELYVVSSGDDSEKIDLEEERKGFFENLIDGMKWSFSELALTISKYVVVGMIMAGFITTIFPSSIIQKYLGNPGMISMASITILACIMYVCAVGHIPFIAALVASGASPGVAITFLIAGAATNLPELISMYNVIGKRCVIIYTATLTIGSIIIGYITNLLLSGNSNIVNSQADGPSVQLANSLFLNIPESITYICSIAIIIFCIIAIFPKMKESINNA
ncbi:efflux transporter SaoE [Clostridioides mangenotii]|nr:efflux transporter SaoE [Clostridioides mangenotii]MCR1954768.1 efflux transporter SaoE [Clostridioides mangenotii]